MQWRSWTYRPVRTFTANHLNNTTATGGGDDDDDDGLNNNCNNNNNNNNNNNTTLESEGLEDQDENEKDVDSGSSPLLPRALRFQSPFSPHASSSSSSGRVASFFAADGVLPWTATATGAAAVFFFLLFLFMPRPWLAADHPPRVQYFNCGNSTQDAAAAGCKFDLMSYTWVHPDCFDQQLMYEFLGEDTWSWALDGDGAQLLNLNEVATGQHEFVYVTWQYYTTHCAYMWRKMHRSLLTSRELDSYVSDYRHTEKCQGVLLDRQRDPAKTSVMLVAKYPSCPVVAP